MYHEFFSGHGVLLLPILAMLLFIGTFSVLVVWTMRKSRSPEFQELASLPLDLKKEAAEVDHV
ncbi:MAG TPA: hypothetical protein PLA87_18585 [Pseudomonadota bacterium]|nr:hypothetical protein [Pseudomonadota bacterium]